MKIAQAEQFHTVHGIEIPKGKRQKMNKEQSRFSFPCVTIEQAAAFEYERKETWTQSPLVNAVIDAARCVRPMNKKELARFLGMDPRDVTYGLHAATGMQLPDFLEAWRIARFKLLLKTQPTLSGKEMAERLGYSSQGALWTFLTKHKQIEPLTQQHWTYGNHIWLKREAQRSVGEDVKTAVMHEINRQKWHYLTKNSK